MKLRVPFQLSSLDEQSVREMNETLQRNSFYTGPTTSSLQSRLSELLRLDSVTTTGSEGSALRLLIEAFDLERGSEIIASPLAVASTLSTIVSCEAVPLLADVDRTTGLLTRNTVEAALTPRTRCVLVPALSGRRAELRGLRQLTSERGIRLVEDVSDAFVSSAPDTVSSSASSHPAQGVLADAVVMDFRDPGLILGAGAGAVGTSCPVLSARLRVLVGSGLVDRSFRDQRKIASPHDLSEITLNCGLDDLRAALILSQINRLEHSYPERCSLASTYEDRLGDARGIRLPAPAVEGARSHPHYPVRVDRGVRRLFQKSLSEAGVATAVINPCVTRFTYFAEYFRDLDLPNACEYGDTVLALPLYPGLAADAQDHVIESLLGALRKFGRR